MLIKLKLQRKNFLEKYILHRPNCNHQILDRIYRSVQWLEVGCHFQEDIKAQQKQHHCTFFYGIITYKWIATKLYGGQQAYGIGALVWNISKELGYLGLLGYNSPDPNSIPAFCHLQPRPTTPSV